MSSDSITTSVAICTCNGAKYIADQLKSILNQSIKPNQIVISDDNSTDNTVEIADRILAHSNIEYVININNPRLGITKNFDKSFTLCNGEIIFPCDQDNVWETTFIESFVDYFINHPEMVLAYCNGWVTDQNLNPIKVTYSDNQIVINEKEDFLLGTLNRTFSPHGHTIAVKNSFVMKCIPSMFYYDSWLPMCAAAEYAIGTINKKLIKFRRHNEASSGSERENNESYLKRIKNKTFDDFFVWPYYQYLAYERYLELYNEKLDYRIVTEVKKHSMFEYDMNSMRDTGRIKSILKLIQLYFSGSYKKFRGNIKTFVLDIFYIVIHSKKQKGQQ